MSVFYGIFDLSVVLKAPFLIAGTNPIDYGTDIAQIRGPRGLPVIPDSHIKGVLRQAWDVSNGAGTGICGDDLFGRGGDSIENNSGRIWFNDLVEKKVNDLGAHKDGSAGKTITRLAIDPDTGAAKPGSLFVIEQVAAPGAKVQFCGPVTLRADSRAEAQEVCDGIALALEFVSSIGKFKTAGFGRLVDHSTGELQEVPAPLAKAFPPGRYDLCFRVNKPLLVDTTRPDGNMFSGSQVITGGTLKGALAAKLQAGGHNPEAGDLGSALSSLTIGHAFAEVENLRAIPLDHVQTGNNKKPVCYNDGSTPSLDKEKDIPRFAPDFKDVSGLAYLGREYRTHVAIDPDTGAARASALFSMSSVLHESELAKDAWEPIVWRAKIDVPDTGNPTEQAEIDRCLTELSHGLFTLGKSKAQTLEPDLRPVKASSASPGAGDWRLVLDTPLLMLRECHLASEKLYWEAIRLYWQKATDGCYEVKESDGLPLIFVQNEYASGYQALRFQYFGAQRLEPFVLTKPGSVFVLECVDKVNGPAKRAELERLGLPVANWREGADGTPGTLEPDANPDFRSCPFGPKNGYGHIRLEGAP